MNSKSKVLLPRRKGESIHGSKKQPVHRIPERTENVKGREHGHHHETQETHKKSRKVATKIPIGFRNRKVNGNLVRIMTIVPSDSRTLDPEFSTFPRGGFCQVVGQKDRGDGVEGVVRRVVTIQPRGYRRPSRKWRQRQERTLVFWEEPRGTVRRPGVRTEGGGSFCGF